VTYLAAGGLPVSLQPANGKGPYVVSAPGLPAGLSVSSTGIISGIPNQGTAGALSINATVTDANGDSANKLIPLTVVAPSAIPGGGTRSTAPNGSKITDQVTIFVVGSDNLPRSGLGVRVRKNGVEYGTPKQTTTNASGKAWFSGLGLNGTTDTLDITVNGQSIANTAITSINAALVTLPVEDYPLPGKRRSASAVLSSGKLLMFGGLPGQLNSPSMLQTDCPNNVVELTTPNSNSWTELTPPGMAPTPAGMYGAAATLLNGRVMIVGGYSCRTGAVLSNAWFMDPNTRAFTPMPLPPSQVTAESVFVQTSATSAVLFGGDNGGGPTAQANGWDDNSGGWTGSQAAPVSARRRAAGVYRPSQNNAWICGGTNGTTAFSDCFTVVNSGFFSMNFQIVQPLPAPREGLAMAYDPANDRIYAFGGRDQNGAYTNTLYMNSASIWTTVSPATLPPARADHSLVWDAANSRLILYGGQNANGNLDDVWTYEAGNWIQRSPVSPARTTYTISGSIAGDPTVPAGTPDYAYVGVTTSSGLRLGTSAFLSSGSGSYSIPGIPAGDTITLTAADRIEGAPSYYKSSVDYGTLGPISSNTNQNIVFTYGAAASNFSGTIGYPAGWTSGPILMPSLSRAGFPTLALVDGFAGASPPYTSFTGNFMAPGGGTSQDLLIGGNDTNIGTCENSSLFMYGIGSGALGSFTLPAGARARTPGSTECSTFGSGLIQSSSAPLSPNGVDVAVGDVTGDGYPDVVTLESGGGLGQLVVFSNVSGAGTNWPIAGTTSVPFGASAISAVDFNKDGKTDIALADTANNRVSIYVSTGTGTFTLATQATVTSPLKVRCADMNGDGNPDVVATGGVSPGGQLVVAFGNGSNALTAPTVYAVGSDPRGFRIADMNADGFPDVVFTQHSAVQARIYNGSANGALTAGAILNSASVNNLIDLVVADFDNDGRKDIVAISDNAGGPFQGVIWRQQSPGSYSVSTIPNIAGRALDVGDVTGDGQPDLVVADPYNTGNMTVYSGNNGNFFIGPSYVGNGQPQGVAVVDLTGDGKPDVAGTHSFMQYFYRQLTPIPVVADSTFAFNAPANTAMVTLRRGAANQTFDWVLYGPTVAGANSYTLPAVSSLATARGSPSGQLSMWSASLMFNPSSGTIDRNELINRLARPGATVTSGGMLYRRQ
ncbi:MAG: FG-GAP-like repeat-containing protein, partial [Myxococcaceae bacterium]